MFPEYEDPPDPFRFGPVCGMCQVIIPDPWYQSLRPIQELELATMTKSRIGFTENSRLACSLELKPEMDGIEVLIPQNETSMPDLDGSPCDKQKERYYES